MLSMQTSKKRIKSDKILGFVLGFCCLILLNGCSTVKQEVSNQPDTLGSETTETLFRHVKVKTSKPTPLYNQKDGKFVECGLVESGIYLDISDQEAQQNMIQINESNLFVKQADVLLSDRWFKNQTHLIPYNKTITTNESYTITNDRNEIQMNLNQSDDYVVYVLPSVDDPRYGIQLQSGIYYIHRDDVKQENEVAGDGQELATSIPVMMYHFFYSEANGETRGDVNYVEVNEFDEQLDYLVQEQFIPLTMREVQYFMEGRGQVPSKSVAITIDDGHPSVYQYAYPLLKEHGLNATLFLIGGWMEPSLPYEFLEMREEGLELQSHSFLMHQGGCAGMGHGGRLLCVSQEDGVIDTKQSFDYVDGGFVYCYPFGDVNENAMQILKDAGTKLAFTTEFGKINPGLDPLKLPRIRVTGGAGIAQYKKHLN